jgi:hypothetical protein
MDTENIIRCDRIWTEEELNDQYASEDDYIKYIETRDMLNEFTRDYDEGGLPEERWYLEDGE